MLLNLKVCNFGMEILCDNILIIWFNFYHVQYVMLCLISCNKNCIPPNLTRQIIELKILLLYFFLSIVCLIMLKQIIFH